MTAAGMARAGIRAVDREELLADLRLLARGLSVAARLTRRARRSANPALAAVLEERAAGHRQAAERVRASLLSSGFPMEHLPPGEGGGAGPTCPADGAHDRKRTGPFRA